jgi:hypothetical protein
MRVVQEAGAPVVANNGIDSTVPPPVRQSAARPPQDDTSLVDVMTGAASTSSSMVPARLEFSLSEQKQRNMGADERRAAWQAERDEARARRKEELEAVANSSPSMQLHLASLEARAAREQQRTADILTRTVNAVADMH